MNINYEIPEALHRDLKIKAAEQGITLKELIIGYLTSSIVLDDNPED